MKLSKERQAGNDIVVCHFTVGCEILNSVTKGVAWDIVCGGLRWLGEGGAETDSRVLHKCSKMKINITFRFPLGGGIDTPPFPEGNSYVEKKKKNQ